MGDPALLSPRKEGRTMGTVRGKIKKGIMIRFISMVFLCLATSGVFILGTGLSTASSQPVVLKPGMPNTIKLPNGEIVYDLNGEWDAVYHLDIKYMGKIDVRESSKDIVRIKQEGNQFVGIKLIGDQWVGKNQETVKGELEKNRLRKVHAFAYDTLEKRAISVPSKGKISEDGNKIVINASPDVNSIMTIVLKRK